MKEEIYTFFRREEYKDTIEFGMCGITYPDESYSISRPNSAIACIEYVEQGTGVVNVGNTKFCPADGDSYFLHPGLDQYYYSDANNPWKKYFVNIKGPLVHAMTDGYNLTNRFHFAGLDLKNELLRIIEIAKHPTENSQLKLLLIINEIFFKMNSHVKSLPRVSGLAQEMKNFLNTKVEQPFKLQELCSYISKSESQTTKIFKEAYGTTPYKYLLDKKIDLAKKLLQDTNLSIGQISQSLSFTDEFYFSNIFKQKTGMRPSEFRKSNYMKK